jgi:hypothetical protein
MIDLQVRWSLYFQRFSLLLALIIFVWALSACEGEAVTPPEPTLTASWTPLPSPTAELTPDDPTPTSRATTTPTAEPTATETPQTGASPDVAALLFPQYTISTTLDYTRHQLFVTEVISYPNTSGDILSELILVVQPNWYQDTFRLRELTWGDDQPFYGYTLEGIQLQVPLVEPLLPGEVLRLSLEFELVLPPLLKSENFSPNPFGYSTRQTNLVDWHPFVPPYQLGEGWLVHNPWYYGEHLVYPVADFDVTIRLVNAPESVFIAASALDENEGDGDAHRYRLMAGRNFVWSASHLYQVLQGQVGDVIVLGYVFVPDAEAGEAAFQATVEAFELYSRLYAPYPHGSLTMVEADFDHGMEYQGLFYLSKAFFSTYTGSIGNYLISIAAHETAHQWWYGLVANDQALEPWLDEAMCTYSERLYYEHLHPDSLDWWWTNRVDYYQPDGFVDVTIYNSEGYFPYRDAVYLRGAQFLEALRIEMGDEAFFAFLREYAAVNTNRLVTGADFFDLLEARGGVDWRALRAVYFSKED